MMRCQPGGLAIFLPEPIDRCSSLSRGLIFTVDEAHVAFGEWHWSLRCGSIKCAGCGATFKFLPDRDLQPLRPGPVKASTTDTQDIKDGVVAHG